MKKYWPFLPDYLSEFIPKDVLQTMIAGMSLRLDCPVLLMECRDPAIHDPSKRRCGQKEMQVIYEAEDMWRYPEFCRYLFKKVPGGRELCLEDSGRRSLNIYEQKGPKFPSRCHMGLITYSQPIRKLDHFMAVCSAGKFIQEGDEELVKKRIDRLKQKLPNGLEKGQEERLLAFISGEYGIRKLNAKDFQEEFHREMASLNKIVEHFLSRHIEERELELNSEIGKFLYEAFIDLQKLKGSVERALKRIKEFFNISYTALFMGKEPGDRILGLFAQAGLSEKAEGSIKVHFNWRKAGLPLKDFNSFQWIEKAVKTPDYLNEYIKDGFKGEDKVLFKEATYLLPVGGELRGLLVIGPFLDSAHENRARKELFWEKGEGQAFITNLGHMLVSQSVSQRAISVLEEKDEWRNLVISLTAHSIRSSIHRIGGHAVSIREALERDELEDITFSGQRIKELVSICKKNIDMILHSPGDAMVPDIDTTEMKWENFPLGALIDNCMENMLGLAEEKEIRLVAKPDIDSFPVVKGDSRLINLVFLNLIDNAIKYSRPRKEVWIVNLTNPSGGDVIIEVSDYGWMIPDKDKERIFEPGFQSKGIRVFRRRGAGLGLYQARQLVRLHKGDIKAKSRPAHEGAKRDEYIVTFTVYLPEKIRII